MENGILVRVGDQEALTGAMTLLAENDELREKPEANALKDSEKFKTGIRRTMRVSLTKSREAGGGVGAASPHMTGAGRFSGRITIDRSRALRSTHFRVQTIQLSELI